MTSATAAVTTNTIAAITIAATPTMTNTGGDRYEPPRRKRGGAFTVLTDLLVGGD